MSNNLHYPLISCWGQQSCEYINYIISDEYIEGIIDGTVKSTPRANCYASIRYINRILYNILKPNGLTASNIEIFVPTADYPFHTDKGDHLSVAMPLTVGATLSVSGFTLNLEKWAAYTFKASDPHKSTGAFLMAEVSVI